MSRTPNGKGDYGYNARAEKYENLFQSGVIDPAKVTRVALENAASIAGMLLTTECVLCNIKEPEPAAPPTPAWAAWAACTKPIVTSEKASVGIASRGFINLLI